MIKLANTLNFVEDLHRIGTWSCICYLFSDFKFCKCCGVLFSFTVEFKACVCYFLLNFCFSPNDSPQKLWKMFFILSKKLFSFSRYSNFCIFVFPSFFFPVSHCLRGWSKKILKIHDVINCLNKNLVTYFVWYLEKLTLTLCLLIEN